MPLILRHNPYLLCLPTKAKKVAITTKMKFDKCKKKIYTKLRENQKLQWKRLLICFAVHWWV